MNPKVENRGDVLLKKWLEGSITWQEERELEQLAQGDAMLTDALAGLRTLPEGAHTKAVERLKGRLQERTERRQRGLVFYLPRVAAAAAMIGALSFGIWFLNKNVNPPQTAIQEQQETAPFAEEEAAFSTEDVPATDTNTAIAMEERATTPVNPGQPSSPIVKPRVPRTDGVVVEKEADTNAELADATLPTSTEETKPDLAAKKAEAAPPAPEAFERARSAATTRAYIAPIGRIVSGKVTNAKGEPLIGASIVIPGTNQGTVSDVDGSFKIEVPPGTAEITLNYTGFESKVINISTLDSVNVKLEESGQSLEEVVVTGFGTKKQNARARKEADAAQLAGKASGVQTLQQPTPRGGFDKLKNYIEKNRRYPKAAQEAKIEGAVEVSFTILPNGKLTDFKIVKSLGYGLDEEAIRLLQEGPRWEMTDPSKAKELGAYVIPFRLKK